MKPTRDITIIDRLIDRHNKSADVHEAACNTERAAANRMIEYRYELTKAGFHYSRWIIVSGQHQDRDVTPAAQNTWRAATVPDTPDGGIKRKCK